MGNICSFGQDTARLLRRRTLDESQEVIVRLQTRRLILERVGETAQPQEFLPVFNSNPDFIEASEQFSGKRSYDLAEVEM